jgi:hypothetical protein
MLKKTARGPFRHGRLSIMPILTTTAISRMGDSMKFEKYWKFAFLGI